VQEHAAPQERERVSLPEFLAEIQAQGQALCRARGCVFRLLTDGTSMLPMRRAELLRALVNLVENAARYTPQGGAVTLESRVRRAPDGAGRAVFTVRDTGPGFTPEALAKGMQPLYTGEKSRPQDGHMGLGLTFAADVARRHGGALALRNAAAERWPSFHFPCGDDADPVYSKRSLPPCHTQGGRLLCAGGAFCFSLQKSLTWSELQMLCLLQNL